jgi:acyl-CoA reductase-like NAD-dependent aldehyde dehydrogenase
MPFAKEGEAIDLVNRSRYGLANGVRSSNIDSADRVAESLIAGNSWINAYTYSDRASHAAATI